MKNWHAPLLSPLYRRCMHRLCFASAHSSFFILRSSFVFLSACLLLSCASGRKVIDVNTLKTDTVIIFKDTSTVVSQRLAGVTLPLPQTLIERQSAADTVSVISDSLYTSIAVFHGGVLSHTLKSNKNAVVHGTVIVSDTIRNVVKSSENRSQNIIKETVEPRKSAFTNINLTIRNVVLPIMIFLISAIICVRISKKYT